ncbi:hypothetical protein LAWASA_1853 [Lawsonibacter asaccharolyticus]|nr:hypothetical protein LAWASA_1853 [Lawsonibacter asaccharolyticus]
MGRSGVLLPGTCPAAGSGRPAQGPEGNITLQAPVPLWGGRLLWTSAKHLSGAACAAAQKYLSPGGVTAGALWLTGRSGRCA